MFSRPTVFVLGAGASWHYGYPTGERLVQDVIAEAKSLSRHYEKWNRYGQYLTAHAQSKAERGSPTNPMALNAAAKKDCDELVGRLQALNPLVIDYFLAQNPSLQDIGRLVISLVILKAEAEWLRTRANINRRRQFQDSPFSEERGRGVDIRKFKDDWCRFVLYNMTSGCRSLSDLMKNQVRFVTFNYDTSLERRLHDGLRAIEIFCDGQLQDFITADRFIHVYGQVGTHEEAAITPVHSPEGDDPSTLANFVGMVDFAWNAAKRIRTIDPEEKEIDQDVLRKARAALDNSAFVYILGYGFDPNNSARIGLQTLRPNTDKALPQIYFTNFQDSNRVNERASLLFHRVPALLPRGTSRVSHTEKSIRDAYQALELDFEFPS